MPPIETNKRSKALYIDRRLTDQAFDAVENYGGAGSDIDKRFATAMALIRAGQLIILPKEGKIEVNSAEGVQPPGSATGPVRA